MILLAEEENTSIQDVEKTLKQAYKSADANYRKSQQTQNQSSMHEALHSKYTGIILFDCYKWKFLHHGAVSQRFF